MTKSQLHNILRQFSFEYQNKFRENVKTIKHNKVRYLPPS